MGRAEHPKGGQVVITRVPRSRDFAIERVGRRDKISRSWFVVHGPAFRQDLFILFILFIVHVNTMLSVLHLEELSMLARAALLVIGLPVLVVALHIFRQLVRSRRLPAPQTYYSLTPRQPPSGPPQRPIATSCGLSLRSMVRISCLVRHGPVQIHVCLQGEGEPSVYFC
jgi:hypothetical protein